MKILHFILGKANPDRANGVNQVIYGLAKYQTLAGHEVKVIGISTSSGIPYEKVSREYFDVDVYRSFNKGGFDAVKEAADRCDIVHLHGVWNRYNIKIGRYLEKQGKPYIITAHCGYAPDRMKQSRYLLKLLYHRLWQKRLYEKAAGIHALTREESTDILRYCRNPNIFVVPNGVDPMVYGHLKHPVHNRERIRFGYLGRISKEKNIDSLIRAFALLPAEYLQKAELELTGPVSSRSGSLQELCRNLGLQDRVHFTGARFGEEKIRTLLDLDIYIHPAYSDVVGISVMEAFAMGIPSIITRTSHMAYFNDSHAFIMVEPTGYDICRGIMQMMDSKEQWEEFSDNAKHLFQSTFNWESAVDKLMVEYKKAVSRQI